MKLFENTKSYWGEQAIRSHLRIVNREVKSCNISKAETIGILFNATHPISFDIVKELSKKITTNDNKVTVLGYVDSKQLIDHYLYRKGFDFFTRKQLNWFYKPQAENVEKFVRTPFDILLDLSLDSPFPIRYILAYSEAKFKAGKYEKDQHMLDFMIDIRKEQENIQNIKRELDDVSKTKKTNNAEVEQIIDEKVQTEMEMNFLINQLIHYLSIIK